MNMLRRNAAAMLAVTLACFSTGASAADTGADALAIRQVLMAQFDKPDARLQVEPVVVAGPAALASWTQGERGGRSLLLRRGAEWQIAVCGGDGLKDARALRDAGVPAADADTLARALATEEARLPPAQRARFSTFDGLLRMDAGGHHPPVHKH